MTGVWSGGRMGYSAGRLTLPCTIAQSFSMVVGDASIAGSSILSLAALLGVYILSQGLPYLFNNRVPVASFLLSK